MNYIIAITLKAQLIKRNLGVRVAAAYLRNRGFTVEKAVAILA